jgi:hypothetical protein
MGRLEKMRESWWPTLVDVRSAKKAMKQGFYAALICGVATVIMAGISWSQNPSERKFSPFAIVDGLLFFMIAAGILRRSRTAAAGGLGYYLFERVFDWIDEGGPRNPIVTICLILAFLNGARAADAYHDFRGSITNHKQILYLNLVALLYSTVFSIVAFALQIAFIIMTGSEYDDLMALIIFSVFLLTYSLSLFKFLPFTKKFNVVTYEFSETDARSEYIVVEEHKPTLKCVDCDFSELEETFSGAELLCPNCKGRLELSN